MANYAGFSQYCWGWLVVIGCAICSDLIEENICCSCCTFWGGRSATPSLPSLMRRCQRLSDVARVWGCMYLWPWVYRCHELYIGCVSCQNKVQTHACFFVYLRVSLQQWSAHVGLICKVWQHSSSRCTTAAVPSPCPLPLSIFVHNSRFKLRVSVA